MKMFKNVAVVEPAIGEVNKGVSKTVPDQAMSIKEILERFASGRPVPNFKGAYYEEDFPDLAGLDFTELDDMKKANLESIENLTQKIRQRRDDLNNASKGEIVEDNEFLNAFNLSKSE